MISIIFGILSNDRVERQSFMKKGNLEPLQSEDTIYFGKNQGSIQESQ